MKRKHRQLFASIIAGTLAFLMFMSLFAQLFFRGTALEASQENLDKLKESLEATKERQEEIEADLDKIAGQKDAVLKEIELLDGRISTLEEEISLNNAIITELSGQIEQKEVEINDMQQKEDEQYKKLRERIRIMYERGDVSYLELLLDADGFYDFLTKYEIIKQISTYEKQLFNEIKALKEQIIVEKEALEADKAQQAESKAQLEAAKSELDSQVAQKQAQMKALEDTESEEKDKLVAFAEDEERINNEIKEMVAALAAQNSGDYVGGTFQWPAPGYTRITSRFGMRMHPVLNVYKLHTGVDIGAPKGAKIVAANDGTVITSTYNASYGNYVVIDHGGNTVTLYAHMSSRSVQKGATVSKGQQIGLVGSTGYSTGAHLHFEVIKNGSYTDPMSYFN